MSPMKKTHKFPFDEVKEEVCSICGVVFNQDLDLDHDVCCDCSDLINDCEVDYEQSEEDLNATFEDFS